MALLAYFAKLLHDFIFTLDGLFEPYLGTRNLLTKAAATEPEKELLLRALLLSIDPEEQSTVSEYTIDHVVESIIEATSYIIPSVSTMGFEERLRSVVKDAAQTWATALRCKVKLEACYSMGSLNGETWKTVPTSVPATDRLEDDPRASMVKLVLFPLVYSRTRDDDELVFPGVVLRQYQCEPARREVESLKASSPTANTDTSTARRLSLTQTTDRNRFLGR